MGSEGRHCRMRHWGAEEWVELVMSGRVSLAVGFVSPGVPSGRGAHLLHTGQLQVSRTRPRTSFPSKCKRVPGYWRPLRALAERDNGRPPPPSPRAVNATSAATTTAAAAGDGVAVDEADAARRQLAERRFAAVRERVAALEQKVQGLEAERRVMLAGRLLRALEDSAFSKRVTAAVADVMAAEPGEADRSAGGAAGTRSAMDKSGEPAAEMSNQEEWLQGIGRICQQTISVLESALSWTAPPSPQRERLQEMLQRVEAVMEGAQLSEMRALTATPASTTETASSGTRDFFNRAIRALRSRSRTNAVTTDEELESVLASAAQMRRTASLKGDMDRVLGAESEPDKEPNTAKRGAISSPASSGAAPGAEGALEECKRRAAELQRVATQFVSETWQRLNGVPVSGDDHGEAAAADGTRGRTAASTGTLMQRQSTILKATMDELKPLERQLQELSKEREARLRREGPLGKLVHIKELRALDDRVNALRRQISVRLLEGEMERIKLTLEAELEAATVLAPLATFNDQEELLLIAEYGLFGKRLAEMQVLVDVGEAALIDDEALAALASDIQDLKARLGMGEDDAYMNLGAMVLDWRRVHQYTAELARKTREGGEFYWRGVRLLGGDLAYTARLIQRAASGYTLTPREVRTIRRTGRDLLTLVPFSVLLALPLTPVGHVLVFSFIQRYFPSFFPSTFTDKRQEIMRRYEGLMRRISTIEASSSEAANADTDGADDTLHRASAAEEAHLVSDEEEEEEEKQKDAPSTHQ
ncbi:hypothetical protein CDCA_CDCA13G3579 [Cyanidium caldarium]|uniref:Letm1 RBD domain-containing protein n=1 Tax=Cyanidium caldarium TaxID=2771 RepID=A0AAV9IZ60_CYACA|nr:hypothetical protein CDCA_CDCA13G3579 [Cyanidium caldarium]